MNIHNTDFDSPVILETPRLFLRRLTPDDAPFIYRLLNTREWIINIGDRNVHSLEDAANYIKNVHLKCYEQHGFGYYIVLLKNNKTPIGICGLLSRLLLPGPDIGFAFMPAYFGRGYAFETATAVMHHTINVLRIKPIYAITMPNNFPSLKLLGKLGFRQYKRIIIDLEELVLLKCADG